MLGSPLASGAPQRKKGAERRPRQEVALRTQGLGLHVVKMANTAETAITVKTIAKTGCICGRWVWKRENCHWNGKPSANRTLYSVDGGGNGANRGSGLGNSGAGVRKGGSVRNLAAPGKATVQRCARVCRRSAARLRAESSTARGVGSSAKTGISKPAAVRSTFGAATSSPAPPQTPQPQGRRFWRASKSRERTSSMIPPDSTSAAGGGVSESSVAFSFSRT
mmetsp:Transcript_44561/g.125872  ORF Transcript_44561/g.125872 Transcript_44561/m.125872 type:complete len:222 (-) Transcript_44561:836-1501(-)